MRQLRWTEPGFRGRLLLGARVAEVCAEALDRVRVILALDEARPARSALEESRSWPGNLRPAREAGEGSAHGLALVADGWSGDERSARLELGEIHAGLRSALGPRRPLATPPLPGDLGPLRDELRARGGPALVELEAGFELWPHVLGTAVAVRALPDGDGLRLSRSLGPVPEERRAATDELALELNARIRFARIVAASEGYALEARLSRARLEPGRVIDSARAVAAASLHVQPRLHVLATEPHLAEAYVRLFPSPESSPPETPCSRPASSSSRICPISAD